MKTLKDDGILSPDFLKIINSVFAALSDILLAGNQKYNPFRSQLSFFLSEAYESEIFNKLVSSANK